MPRSAGQAITWKEERVPRELRQILAPGTRGFISPESKCQVLVSREKPHGWHLSISHPWRNPTWDEIASARYQLVPDDVSMAMILPPSAQYVNLHEKCFHLFQCGCDAGKVKR